MFCIDLYNNVHISKCRWNTCSDGLFTKYRFFKFLYLFMACSISDRQANELTPAQPEMVVGPRGTLQMGKLVPYRGPSHPDGKMSQKCQGRPNWLRSRYSSVIHHWTTAKKRPNCPTLKCCHRQIIGTVAISQRVIQYFIGLLFI